MRSIGAMLSQFLFMALSLFSVASTGSTSSRLSGGVCLRRINRTITYMQPVRYTKLVRTRKCRFVIFCKTIYRTQELYRLEMRTRTLYHMRRECCEGFYERNKVCIPGPTYNPHLLTTSRDPSFYPTPDISLLPYELLTSTMMQQRTTFDDTKINSVAQNSSNVTRPILLGKTHEVRITDSNNTTVIVAFIGCSLSVFIIIIVIVIYKRRKKAAKYMSEIPYSPDVMPLPSKSKKDCSAIQDGMNSRNFPATDENFYMSMDNGFKLPSVKMMLATRGSGYRFSGLEDDPHRHTDSLYMPPDPATCNNENTKSNNPLNRKSFNKSKHGKNLTDIYINDQDINMADKIPEDDEENIYSEIKAKTLKESLPRDENGYSFIRMHSLKGPEAEERHCKAETSLYSSLNENKSNSNPNVKDREINSMMSSQPTNTCNETRDTYDRAKIRTSIGRKTYNEKEERDNACDSGIYTSISPDSDKDDEIYPDPTYDRPNFKDTPEVEDMKIQTGSDFYENCQRNTDESNYDVPRSQTKDEDAIYSDISSTSKGSPVISRVS